MSSRPTGLYGFCIRSVKLCCMSPRHLLGRGSPPTMEFRRMYFSENLNEWIAVHQCPTCGRESLITRDRRGLVKALRW